MTETIPVGYAGTGMQARGRAVFKFTQKSCPTRMNTNHSRNKASHHGSGGRVVIVTANVAAPVIGQDNACQPSVQGNMGLVISGEDQQMGCIIPPADFFLFKKKQTVTSAMSSIQNKDLRTSIAEKPDKLSWTATTALEHKPELRNVGFIPHKEAIPPLMAEARLLQLHT